LPKSCTFRPIGSRRLLGPARSHGEKALRLARYFGTSAEFWLGMQKDYDLQVARDEFETKVEREVRPRDRAA
jgi:plasmid maintenance system antidote protein VapI